MIMWIEESLFLEKPPRSAPPLSARLKEVEAGGEVGYRDTCFFSCEELLALEVVDGDGGIVGSGDVEMGGGGVGVVVNHNSLH